LSAETTLRPTEAAKQATRLPRRPLILSGEQFQFIMANLPEEVAESEAREMFNKADQDGNAYITYRVRTSAMRETNYSPRLGETAAIPLLALLG